MELGPFVLAVTHTPRAHLTLQGQMAYCVLHGRFLRQVKLDRPLCLSLRLLYLRVVFDRLAAFKRGQLLNGQTAQIVDGLLLCG